MWSVMRPCVCPVQTHEKKIRALRTPSPDAWDREFETYMTTSSPDPLSFSSRKQTVDFYPFVTSSGFDMYRVTWNMNTLYALPYNTSQMTYNPRQYKVSLPSVEILARLSGSMAGKSMTMTLQLHQIYWPAHLVLYPWLHSQTMGVQPRTLTG
jgi:hypothetical protein